MDLEHPNVFSLAIEGKIKLFFEPIPLKELSFEVDQLQRCILCISFSKERFLGDNLMKSLNNNFIPSYGYFSSKPIIIEVNLRVWNFL